MQKYVFLAISVFVLGYFQGINGGCATPGCTCPKIPDTDLFNARVFGKNHINYMCYFTTL